MTRKKMAMTVAPKIAALIVVRTCQRRIAVMRKAAIPVERTHRMGHIQMKMMRQWLGPRNNVDQMPMLLQPNLHPTKSEKQRATQLGGVK